MPTSKKRKKKGSRPNARTTASRLDPAGRVPEIDTGMALGSLMNVAPASLPIHAAATSWQAMQAGTPATICQIACLSLQRALSHYGIASELRVVDAVITGPNGATSAVGSPAPRWIGNEWTGHTVLVVPSSDNLVDLTLNQSPLLPKTGLHGRPIIVRLPDVTAWPTEQPIAILRAPYAIGYTLLPQQAQQSWRGPVVERHRARAEQQGDAIAAHALELMTTPILIDRTRSVPYPTLLAQLAPTTA